MPGSRSASLIITVFGAVTNLALAIQVLATWRSLRWEPDSEWEASGDSWRVDGFKVIWGLLSAYFASTAIVCTVGFMGILKNKPTLIRFYRDYSIADFSFCTFFTAVTTYAAFRAAARTTVCEELSHHPELMRDMLEMGLNLENCERWLERAVLAFVAVMVVIIVIRLHFLLAVSNYHSQLARSQKGASRSRSRSHSRSSQRETDDLQRIYLLPHPHSDSSPELVYAPVSLSSLPKDIRECITEAWVSPNNPRSGSGRHSRTPSESSGSIYHDQTGQRPTKHHRRHSHHHRQSRSSSATRTGQIYLPVQPEEGLLPVYYIDADIKAA